MNSMQEAYIKNLKPTTAIKISNLTLGSKSTDEIIKEIHNTLSYKYNTFLDEENGVIYVGKRI